MWSLEYNHVLMLRTLYMFFFFFLWGKNIGQWSHLDYSKVLQNQHDEAAACCRTVHIKQLLFLLHNAKTSKWYLMNWSGQWIRHENHCTPEQATQYDGRTDSPFCPRTWHTFRKSMLRVKPRCNFSNTKSNLERHIRIPLIPGNGLLRFQSLFKCISHQTVDKKLRGGGESHLNYEYIWIEAGCLFIEAQALVIPQQALKDSHFHYCSNIYVTLKLIGGRTY